MLIVPTATPAHRYIRKKYAAGEVSVSVSYNPGIKHKILYLFIFTFTFSFVVFVICLSVTGLRVYADVGVVI